MGALVHLCRKIGIISLSVVFTNQRKKSLLKQPNKMPLPEKPTDPIRLAADHYGISPRLLSPKARIVIDQLQEQGHEAYLVGGGVRDLLLGREPKDFDVATSALPEDVRQLFRNCRLVGRRFRLAHVRFGREIIEVATFRAPHDHENSTLLADVSPEGRLLRDNVYGTLAQDAWRRDFTINALYYDPNEGMIIDHVGGLEDLWEGRLRLIGDPEQRYREDPVRMLRAVRFMGKLGFVLAPETESAIHEWHGLLEDVAPARLFDEVVKLMHGGAGVQTFELLRHFGLFKHLFPETERLLGQEREGFPHQFITRALANTDQRIGYGKPVTPAFLFAVFLWDPLQELIRKSSRNSHGKKDRSALIDETLRRAAHHVSIPARFAQTVRDIWSMQSNLHERFKPKVLEIMEHPRFRAAYDFYCLRAMVGEADSDICQWWTRLQEMDNADRQALIAGLPEPPKRRRRHRKNGRHPTRRS